MISQISSLKTPGQFGYVNKFGKKLKCSYFTILVCSDKSVSSSIFPDSTFINLGIKASKKLGSAVIRNKIKRRIKHLCREATKTIINSVGYISSNLRIIFIPYKGMHSVNFADLLNAFLTLLSPLSISNF
jgi:ribonuclease P protein component